jgi:hypothetical protein
MARIFLHNYPAQQARVRRIQRNAQAIGPTGAFLVAVSEEILMRADKAALSDDVAEQFAAYEAMENLKE